MNYEPNCAKERADITPTSDLGQTDGRADGLITVGRRQSEGLINFENYSKLQNSVRFA